MVATALRAACPTLATEIQTIKTTGDAIREASPISVEKRFGRKGLFTAEIENQLRAGEIDVAVHSAKDLPNHIARGVEIAAVLKRAPVEDALVSKSDGGLRSLPRGAIVATGSIRRMNQLRSKRSDLQVVSLRGNVPTRLRKLVEHDWNAVLLACAGLDRLGLQPGEGSIVFEGMKLFVELLSRSEFVPAGGQGVIALQVRSGDESSKELVQRVNHRETFCCLRAEREFLRLLEADCNSPIGVVAEIANQEMHLWAQVFDNGLARTEKMQSSMKNHQPEEIAALLFKRMYGDKRSNDQDR